MNITIHTSLGFLIGCCLAGAVGVRAASPGPEFDEIYQLLRKNLAGATEADLEKAAVQGFVSQLYPLVSFVTNTAASTTNTGALSSAIVIDGVYGYVRIAQVAAGIEREFTAALKRLGSTNKLKGLVIDLRFGEGHDYQAAAALADNFFTTRQPLIDWGEGTKFSSPKSNAISLPTAILVNHHTIGAAEAFAGILRRSEVGIVLGTNTAGQASISQEFTLKDGRRLRVATQPIKVADESTIGRQGVVPDILVEVSPSEERQFLQDPYRVVPTLADRADAAAVSTNQTAQLTNRQTRRRINEAELVRMQREGFDLEPDVVTGREAGPTRPPMITDPALARAIDLLKGLSVVHKFRSF